MSIGPDRPGIEAVWRLPGMVSHTAPTTSATSNSMMTPIARQHTGEGSDKGGHAVQGDRTRGPWETTKW